MPGLIFYATLSSDNKPYRYHLNMKYNFIHCFCIIILRNMYHITLLILKHDQSSFRKRKDFSPTDMLFSSKRWY